MSGLAADGQAAYPLYRAERVISSLTVAWVIGLTTFMIFQDDVMSATDIYFLKIVLALSGGVMLATLPGFFDLNYRFGGLSVRAAGGSAAFIFIYTQSPALPAFHDGGGAMRPSAQAVRQTRNALRTARRMDGLPVLMALSIAPAGFIPNEASNQMAPGGTRRDAAGKGGSASIKASHGVPKSEGCEPGHGWRWRRSADDAIGRLNRASVAVRARVGRSIDEVAKATGRAISRLRSLRAAAGNPVQQSDAPETHRRLRGTGGMTDRFAPPTRRLAGPASETAGTIATKVPGPARTRRAILGHSDAGFDMMAKNPNEMSRWLDPHLAGAATAGALDGLADEGFTSQETPATGIPMYPPGGNPADITLQGGSLLSEDDEGTVSACISGCDGEVAGAVSDENDENDGASEEAAGGASQQALVAEAVTGKKAGKGHGKDP